MNNFPEWVLKHKQKGTAIHKIGNNYYLYKVTSKWDKELGRARKITEGYLGVITEEGLKQPWFKQVSPTTLKEYGASQFLIEGNKDILERLKKWFPKWWKELFIVSALRLMYTAPLKHMETHYEDSWFSEELRGARLYGRSIHSLLEEVGANRESIIGFLREFVSEKEAVLIDLTNVFSLAEEMLLSAKGYNSKFEFTPQVNVLFIFSINKKLPMFYRVLPGNVRDVATLKATIEESGIENTVIIADKGFYSKNNIELLEKENLNYILPLKRDNQLIDYSPLEKPRKESFEGWFSYKKRYIWYYKCKTQPIWVFLDEHLRVNEEETYLSKIETHPEEYSTKGFYKRMPKFGTIALMTNMNKLTPESIYQFFKSRSEIETMFDAFKNVLHADRTYMRNDKTMETWMFINYLSLTYYYRIYNILIRQDLLKKYAPLDIMLHLSKIRKVKLGEKWLLGEIPKQTRKLIEKLNIHIT